MFFYISVSTTNSHFHLRPSLLNFPWQRSSLYEAVVLDSDKCRRKVAFLRQLFQAFGLSLLVPEGQTKPRDYDSPRNLCIRQIYDFPRASGLLRIQARLHVLFIRCIGALRDSQSQALNSNLLRDNLKLQW